MRAASRVLSAARNQSNLRSFNQTVQRFPVRFAHSVPEAPRAQIPVTFVTFDGHRYTVTASVGSTILETADAHQVPVYGDCGGGGWPRDNYGEGPMCRTCLVYIDNAHVHTVAPPNEDEDQIQFWSTQTNKNSRLACETVITPEMSGATIIIPDVQPLKEWQV